MDILSCIILILISGAVGLVIFLLFFKEKIGTVIPKAETKAKDCVISYNERDSDLLKLTNKPSHSNQKKKTIKGSYASHPLLLTSLRGHTASVTGIAVSSNGKFLASSSEDRTVRLWNVKDFASKDHKYTRCNVEFDYPSCISFSPDSRAFIVGLASEKVIRVFKIHKKKEEGMPNMTITQEFDFPKEHRLEIIDVAVSSNGKFIMSADKGTQIVVWTTKGDVLDRIDTLLIYNTEVSISPCGNLIGACGFTPDLKLWHVGFNKSNEFTQTSKVCGLKGHSSGILSFSFTNDSKRIATISKDNTWKVWDIDVDYLKGQEAYLLHTGCFTGLNEGIPAHVALSHDYFTIAISLGQSIQIHLTLTQKLEEILTDVHQGSITGVCWLADSKHLVSAGGSDRSIRIWHNPASVKANLQCLISKLTTAKSDTMKERIQKQIKEAEEYLLNF